MSDCKTKWMQSLKVSVGDEISHILKVLQSRNYCQRSRCGVFKEKFATAYVEAVPLGSAGDPETTGGWRAEPLWSCCGAAWVGRGDPNTLTPAAWPVQGPLGVERIMERIGTG